MNRLSSLSYRLRPRRRTRSRPRKCIEYSRQKFPFLEDEDEHEDEHEDEKNQIRPHAYDLRLFLFSALRIPTSEFLTPET